MPPETDIDIDRDATEVMTEQDAQTAEAIAEAIENERDHDYQGEETVADDDVSAMLTHLEEDGE